MADLRSQKDYSSPLGYCDNSLDSESFPIWQEMSQQFLSQGL